MSDVFVTELPIRWGDIDAARVVYFPKMVNLVHVAMEDFFTLGLERPYPKMIREEQIGFPTVHLDCDFFVPCRYGDVTRWEVTVAELGNKKVVFRYHVTRDGTPVYRCRQVTVCAHTETFTGRPLPDDYRVALQRYLREDD